jgi:fumarate hydratase subunit beta
MEYHLTTPLSESDVTQLNAGDIIYLTGTVFTARDEAHARILEVEEKGEPLPFDLDGAVIYHCGPLMQQIDNKWRVVAAGPTTSGRMSKMTPPLLETGNAGSGMGT